MHRITNEPLVHFLLIGAVLFVIGLVRGGEDDSAGNDRIAITPGHVERFIAGFELTWNRPPTAQELEGLIDTWINQEILYREALAMGLDRDDEIVRRRMSQKLEFLSEDLIDSAEPADEELQAFLDENAATYAHEPDYSLEQVCLTESRHGDALDADARALLAQLRRNQVPVSSAGDPLPLPASFARVTPRELEATFGPEFVENLASVARGQWAGPVRSTYGVHLVWIEDLTPATPASLDEVRLAVRRDFMQKRREAANAEFMGALRSRYLITVEWPEELGGGRAEIQ
jgi:hypothetical protein